MFGVGRASAAGPPSPTWDGSVPPVEAGNVWLTDAVGELGTGPPAGVLAESPPQPQGALTEPGPTEPSPGRPSLRARLVRWRCHSHHARTSATMSSHHRTALRRYAFRATAAPIPLNMTRCGRVASRLFWPWRCAVRGSGTPVE